MFQEMCLAPFKQTISFRSPDVALLPFVSGSTHAVMTPFWTPGFCVLLAPAIAATAANKTTPAAASSVVDGDLTITSSLPGSSGGGWSAPRIGFSEAGQEVAQVERCTAINA
jgi:hypothetical protein